MIIMGYMRMGIYIDGRDIQVIRQVRSSNQYNNYTFSPCHKAILCAITGQKKELTTISILSEGKYIYL